MFTTYRKKDLDAIAIIREALLSSNASCQREARAALLQFIQADSWVALTQVIPLLVCMLRPEKERLESWRHVNPEEVINLLLFLTQNNAHSQKIFNALLESGGLKLLTLYRGRGNPNVDELVSCLELISYAEMKVSWVNEINSQISKINAAKKEIARLERERQGLEQHRECIISQREGRLFGVGPATLELSFPSPEAVQLQLIVVEFSAHFPPFQNNSVSCRLKLAVEFFFFGSHCPEGQVVYQYIRSNRQSIYQTSGPLINLYKIIRGWAACPVDFLERAGEWTAAVQEYIPSASALIGEYAFFGAESEIKPKPFEITKSP